MTVALVVQARMSSTRLPGKVLLPVMGRSLLSYQIERLRRVRRADALVVATTIGAADDPIVTLCEKESVLVARGSEADVLHRYQEAATAVGASTVVRVTSDCPLIDPTVVDDVIDALMGAPERVDYASNMLRPTYPYGQAVEAFSAEALAAAHHEATDPVEREHVTPFIYRRPQRFSLRSVELDCDLTHHRWTVDTVEDFDLVRRLIEALSVRESGFLMADVLAVIAENPQWGEINRQVRQKRLGE